MDQFGNVTAASSEDVSAPDVSTDLCDIRQVVEEFFGAFTSGPGLDARLDRLAVLMLPQAVVVRGGGGHPVVSSVEEFIAPRRLLLTSGQLIDFAEWPETSRIDVFGDLAHYFCVYAKRGRRDGITFEARGVKSVQLVRTPTGWRISALSWHDEEAARPVPALSELSHV